MNVPQDKMLEDIGKGIGNLHNHAMNINQEATAHNQILETLDVQVDMATGIRRGPLRPLPNITPQVHRSRPTRPPPF
jgi:hypothetical protein